MATYDNLINANLAPESIVESNIFASMPEIPGEVTITNKPGFFGRLLGRTATETRGAAKNTLDHFLSLGISMPVEGEAGTKSVQVIHEAAGAADQLESAFQSKANNFTPDLTKVAADHKKLVAGIETLEKNINTAHQHLYVGLPDVRERATRYFLEANEDLGKIQRAATNKTTLATTDFTQQRNISAGTGHFDVVGDKIHYYDHLNTAPLEIGEIKNGAVVLNNKNLDQARKNLQDWHTNVLKKTNSLIDAAKAEFTLQHAELAKYKTLADKAGTELLSLPPKFTGKPPSVPGATTAAAALTEAEQAELKSLGGGLKAGEDGFFKNLKAKWNITDINDKGELAKRGGWSKAFKAGVTVGGGALIFDGGRRIWNGMSGNQIGTDESGKPINADTGTAITGVAEAAGGVGGLAWAWTGAQKLATATVTKILPRL